MTSRASFIGSVSETGRLSLDDLEAYRAALKPYRGKRVVLSLSQPRREKTQPQLAYYWATILPEFAEFVGEQDTRALHHDLKDAFLQKRERVNHLTGEIVLEIPSLADLSIEQMSEYMDAVLVQAAKLGVHISPPRS